MNNVVLEFLPNEILLYIFEFLNNFHLLYAFYNINSRLNYIIYTYFQSHPLDFRSIPKRHFDIICQEYLPSIYNYITSFCLSDSNKTSNQVKLFYSYQFDIKQFFHLKSLTLHCIPSWDVLLHITDECRYLQYLTHLNITDNDNEYLYKYRIDHKLMNNIWNLSKLISCNLHYIIENIYSREKISFKSSSSIKYLCLNQSFYDINILFDLFKHTPNLERFTTHILYSSDEQILSTQIFPTLITKFKCVYGGDKQLLIILLQNMPNLNQLILDIYDNFWNGYDWEKILTNYLPNIKIFQFKMNFTFSFSTDIEIQVNQLLDSFQTVFWIYKYQWFVRCHWIPFRDNKTNNYNIIYTLPYRFKNFYYLHNYRCKSTCPNETDYCTYNSVQNILLSNFKLHSEKDIPPFRLPYLHHCSLRQFLNDEFWIYNSFFNELNSLVIESVLEQTSYRKLQTLIDKAPNLSSLIFHGLIIKPIRLLNLTNTSICCLNFQNAFFPSEDYFNYRDCITLSNSSLGQQCQSLMIRVKDRISILYLVINMSNLQSLIVQCEEDPIKSAYVKINRINDHVYQWLHDNLPPTCSIIRCSNYPYNWFGIWISNETFKVGKHLYLLKFFKRWPLLAKYLTFRCVS